MTKSYARTTQRNKISSADRYTIDDALAWLNAVHRHCTTKKTPFLVQDMFEYRGYSAFNPAARDLFIVRRDGKLGHRWVDITNIPTTTMAKALLLQKQHNDVNKAIVRKQKQLLKINPPEIKPDLIDLPLADIPPLKPPTPGKICEDLLFDQEILGIEPPPIFQPTDYSHYTYQEKIDMIHEKIDRLLFVWGEDK